MKNLEQYIAPLLAQHDCVIIPGFGGFLLIDKPAGFSMTSNEMYPRSRTVSFNRNLNVNDGLLAQHIAQQENILYHEALSIIADGIGKWIEILGNGQYLKFAGAGTITQNSEGRLIFTPDYTYNYLIASFGLPNLLLSPVEKPNTGKIYKLPKRQLAAKQNTHERFRVSAAAVSIAASLLIAFLVFVKNAQVDSAQVAQAVNSKHIKAEPVAASLNAILAHARKVQKQEAESTNPLSKYYVVGGSFKSEANARILEKELQKKGYEASVLNTENGLYRVTYLQEHDSTKADMGLHKIKISENQAAWLLKW